MHFESPSDSWDPCGKAKPRYILYIIRWGEAKLCLLELTSVFHHLPSVGPKQLYALAHLGCTYAAVTSWYFLIFFSAESDGEILLPHVNRSIGTRITATPNSDNDDDAEPEVILDIGKLIS